MIFSWCCVVFILDLLTPISFEMACMACRLIATVAGSGASPGVGSVAEE